MIRKGIVSVIIIFIAISTCRGKDEIMTENKNILILFAMQPTTPAYRNLLDGIRAKLENDYNDQYTLHFEYLEMDRYTDDSIPVQRIKSYNQKYRNVKLDLLICIGINVIEILRNNLDDYLLDVPVVSLDYDFSNYGLSRNIDLNDKTTTIPLKVEAGKTIASILELFPNTVYLYFICGVAPGDRLFYEVSRQEAAKLPKEMQVKFISDVSMDEVLKVVRYLPENSIIIVPRFSIDSKQVNYYNTEAVRLISKAASAPVFTYTTMGFGDGSVGGYIMNFDKAGQLIGEAAVKILNGAEPESLHFSEKDYYEFMFDWRELNRWNIDDSKLIPKGSRILFEEITFFGKYKWIISGGILFLVLQSFLIGRLILQNRKQRSMAVLIRETETKYRKLIREDRILQIAQLTASLSHELNQPLTAILSNAQAGIRFVNSGNNTPELMNEIFQNIVEDDKRTASILSSVRGMLKLEKREKEHVNLNSLVNEVVAIFLSEARVHNIEIHIRLPEEPVYIFADGIQVQQVILNFIFNAMQSIEHSKTHNRIIIITESIDKENVTMAVRDFGKGISEEVKDKLFKPFVTSKKEGLGIGLSISQSIIQDHNGKIWAENKHDGGAEFSFSLKIQKV